ncbi:MAG: hypothetical protein ACRCX2_23445 [Paraclostridium sp.]
MDNKDLNLFFDSFIKTTELVREKEVVPGLTVKLRALNAGDLLVAQSIMSHSDSPTDIVVKIRAASILSQSLLNLNDMDIEREGFTEKEIRDRRVLLYSQLLKMPGIVIQKMYEFYLEVVEEQNEKYKNFPKTVDDITNF